MIFCVPRSDRIRQAMEEDITKAVDDIKEKKSQLQTFDLKKAWYPRLWSYDWQSNFFTYIYAQWTLLKHDRSKNMARQWLRKLRCPWLWVLLKPLLVLWLRWGIWQSLPLNEKHPQLPKIRQRPKRPKSEAYVTIFQSFFGVHGPIVRSTSSRLYI